MGDGGRGGGAGRLSALLYFQCCILFITLLFLSPLVVLYGGIAIGFAYGMKALEGPVTQVSFVPVSCVVRYECFAVTSYPGEFFYPSAVLHGSKIFQGPVTQVNVILISCVVWYEGLAMPSHPDEFRTCQLCCTVRRPCNDQSPRRFSYLPVVLYCTKALQGPVTQVCYVPVSCVV